MDKLYITQEQFSDALDKIYGQVINGISGSKTCHDLASEYLLKYPDVEKAINIFSKTQITKCAVSGFVTSLGGAITLPVAIPANLASVLYIQMRSIVTIAVMSGYDPKDDEVQTLTYVCLTGLSISNVCKEVGIQFSKKIGVAAIRKIPTEVLKSINKRLAFRFITKFGEKGLINLGKMVPVLGGVIGGGFDYIGTKAITSKAKKVFLLEEIE